MKDFTFLRDGIPKQLVNGLFNFKKLRDIVDKVSGCVHTSASVVMLLLFSSRN